MRRLLLIGLMMLLMSGSVFAAFERTTGLPTILIGEVRGYGENELIPKYFEDFRDELAAALQRSNKVNIDVSRIMLNAGDEPTDEDKLFSLLHKDAIANGALYRREYANAEMIRYADVIKGGGDPKKGRQYFQDDAITKERMNRAGKPYDLTFTAVKQVNELGRRYNADYILFVNLRDADVWRKTGGIFGTSTDYDYRGKKILVELEYYLINTKTGKVYEGQNAEKKTSLTTNVLVGKYGNNFTVHDMVNYVLKDQAEKVADGVLNKALKIIGSK